MTKRLQVLLPDPEYREIQKIARSRRISVAQWVRQALHAAKREEPMADVSSKLEALRAAAKLEFPTADIEQMLAEIEQGYLSGDKH
jgi:ribbon-helix-helix CopG family protein